MPSRRSSFQSASPVRLLGPAFAAFAALAACVAHPVGPDGAATSDAGAATSDAGAATSDAGATPAPLVPTIWLTSSPAIDPTALPLGDQRFVNDAPKKGNVFVCDPRMFEMTGTHGAVADGPWIDATTKTYDVTKKLYFGGAVVYDDAQLAIVVDGDQRRITANGFPVGVATGVFPVSHDDPAYPYDHNPNEVTSQAISFAVPSHPSLAASASCIYKQVGITLDGVQVHGPLDSTGRDELAYEVQDGCTGASQPGGGYHRHALGECMPHVHEPNALLGYALDGFGIFSPYDKDGKELATADLDECHGTTSEILWEGATVTMYHYVLTRDYPYTVGCFRGTPTRNAFPTLPGAPTEH